MQAQARPRMPAYPSGPGAVNYGMGPSNPANPNINYASNSLNFPNHLQNKQMPPRPPMPMANHAGLPKLTSAPNEKVLPPPPPVRPVAVHMPKEIDPTQKKKENMTTDVQLWGSANTGITLFFLLTLASAVFVIPMNLRFFWVVFIALVVLELIAFFLYANVAENSSETAQTAAKVLLYGQYILFCVTFVGLLIALSIKVYGLLNTKTNLFSQKEVSGNEKVIEEVKLKLDEIKRKKSKKPFY